MKTQLITLATLSASAHAGTTSYGSAVDTTQTTPAPSYSPAVDPAGTYCDPNDTTCDPCAMAPELCDPTTGGPVDCDDSDDESTNDCPMVDPVAPCDPSYGDCPAVSPTAACDPYVDANCPMPVEPCPDGQISIGDGVCDFPVVDTNTFNDIIAPDYVYDPKCDHTYGQDMYVENTQQQCGVMFIDIVKYMVDYWLKDYVNQPVYTDIMNYVDQINTGADGLANTPADIANIIAQSSKATDYCHGTDIAPDYQNKLVDVFQKCAVAYNNVFKAPVDQAVYDGFNGVWDACKNNQSYDYAELLLHALSNFFNDPKKAIEDIKNLAGASYPDIANAGQTLESTVNNMVYKTLDAGDKNLPNTNSAANSVVVGFGAIAVAVVALIM